MPTGYTARIKDGITFKGYALLCARAFGATIDMKDDPMDEPIPDEFAASNYYTEKLDDAESRLKGLKLLTKSDVDEAATEWWKREEKVRIKRLDEIRNLKNKYEIMLNSVDNWTAPSSDHDGLHKFMRNQITESIKFDCNEEYYINPIQKITGEYWAKREIEKAKHDIEYFTKEKEKESERVASRNKWIAQLRESLS